MPEQIFVVRKLFENGEIERLVIGRLLYQTRELLRAIDRDEAEREKILTYVIKRLMPEMIHCGNISWGLWEEAKTMAENVKINEYGAIENMPHLINLEERVGDFLYNTKNALRDLTEIVNFFFQTNFRNARDFFSNRDQGDGRITTWAREQFGDGNELTEMLRCHQVWIKETVQKRNAVEHPGGHSGRLIVTNFEIGNNGIELPTWTRDLANQNEKLLDDVRSTFVTLLRFSEDLIFRCIEKNLAAPLQIHAIPDEEQDAAMPIRLKYFLPKSGQSG